MAYHVSLGLIPDIKDTGLTDLSAGCTTEIVDSRSEDSNARRFAILV